MVEPTSSMGDPAIEATGGGVGFPPFRVAPSPVRPAAVRTSSVARITPHRSDPARPGAVDHDARASIRASRRRFVTVLFTDIVDSTRTAAAMGDRRWLDLLSAHEAMAAEAVRRFRGRVIRATGDGMLATFGTATAGALCAARIRDASGGFEVEIRAGLHAGECERSPGSVGGLVFHIGSRVASLAGPSQILMSQTVTTLLVGAGVASRPYGRCALKGLSGEWELSELEASGNARS